MKHFLFTTLFIVAACLSGYAQARRAQLYTGVDRENTALAEVRFENAESFIRGDTLFIGFDLGLRGKVMASGEALHISPVYKVGRQELRFPEIIINGKKRARYYRREQALLSHETYWAEKPYAAILYDGKGSFETLRYDIAEPLPSDMREGGKLSIEQYIEDCCDMRFIAAQPFDIKTWHAASLPAQPETTQPKVELEIARPVYESSVTFIRPQKEVVKERNESLTLRINYPVNGYEVLPHFANNALELRIVDDLLLPLSSRKETYQLKSATIKGYASPEAPYEYNLKLSQRRADSFKQYLITRYGLYSLSNFPASGLGEDWDGLRTAVEKSAMPYRESVLSIIDGVGIFNGREKMLMDLAGGEAYRYMLRMLYPPLRRMEMDVAYTVRSFETIEAEEVIKKRPQDLSQEEIYEVARKRNTDKTAESNRKDYGREYELAAKYFPNDATANINAASAALVRGNLDEAWRYLSKVQNVPEAYNNLGVYHWLRGDTVRAEQYFRRALNVKGDEEKAARNLKLLKEYVGKR